MLGSTTRSLEELSVGEYERFVVTLGEPQMGTACRGSLERFDESSRMQRRSLGVTEQARKHDYRPSGCANTSDALCPPKPNELLIATRMGARLAVCGT